jgi:hypothetical protein
MIIVVFAVHKLVKAAAFNLDSGEEYEKVSKLINYKLMR